VPPLCALGELAPEPTEAALLRTALKPHPRLRPSITEGVRMILLLLALLISPAHAELC
jgi:hypothetical protein